MKKAQFFAEDVLNFLGRRRHTDSFVHIGRTAHNATKADTVLDTKEATFVSPLMCYLEQLHSDHSKHELKQVGDQHDVSYSFDCYYDALDYVLEGKIKVVSTMGRVARRLRERSPQGQRDGHIYLKLW